MSEAPNSKLSAAAGGLFLIAGVAFALAALLGDQPVFYGAAAAFVGVGVVFVAKARQAG